MIYFIENVDTGHIKVGFTHSNPEKRLETLQVGSPATIVLLAVMHGDREDERNIHVLFKRHHARGEWFRRHIDIYKYIAQCAELREAASYTTSLLQVVDAWPLLGHDTKQKITELAKKPVGDHDHVAAQCAVS